MLGFPLLYFKGMRILMFQLSGFYNIREHSAKARLITGIAPIQSRVSQTPPSLRETTHPKPLARHPKQDIEHSP